MRKIDEEIGSENQQITLKKRLRLRMVKGWAEIFLSRNLVRLFPVKYFN